MNPAAIVYGLCLIASLFCAALLFRAWLRARTQLLFWTAVSFGFFALNNLLLVADMLAFPHVDLWLPRSAAAAAAIGVLLYGFIWQRQ